MHGPVANWWTTRGVLGTTKKVGGQPCGSRECLLTACSRRSRVAFTAAERSGSRPRSNQRLRPTEEPRRRPETTAAGGRADTVRSGRGAQANRNERPARWWGEPQEPAGSETRALRCNGPGNGTSPAEAPASTGDVGDRRQANAGQRSLGGCSADWWPRRRRPAPAGRRPGSPPFCRRFRADDRTGRHRAHRHERRARRHRVGDRAPRPTSPSHEADEPLVLAFGHDGRVSGTTGVNQLTASYSLTADYLTFGPLATTRRSGTPEQMEQEHRRGAVARGDVPVRAHRPHAVDRGSARDGRAGQHHAAAGARDPPGATSRSPRPTDGVSS